MDILENFANGLRVTLRGTFADLERAEAHHGDDGLSVTGGKVGATQGYVPQGGVEESRLPVYNV